MPLPQLPPIGCSRWWSGTIFQVAREALVRSIPRLHAVEPAEAYLRPCIQGALHHHRRDRVRLVRISRREHEKGTSPLGHHSLDLCPAGEGEESLLDQLVAPSSPSLEQEALVLEQLVEQLPAGQAAALRLTVLEGLSLRAAGTQLGISDMTVQRAQQRAIAALRQLLDAGG